MAGQTSPLRTRPSAPRWTGPSSCSRPRRRTVLRENDAPSGAERSFIAAIQTNNIDAVKALLEAGADVNEPAYTTKTPLHYASHSRNKEILKLMMTEGADLEAKTEQGFTPLVLRRRVEPS